MRYCELFLTTNAVVSNPQETFSDFNVLLAYAIVVVGNERSGQAASRTKGHTQGDDHGSEPRTRTPRAWIASRSLTAATSSSPRTRIRIVPATEGDGASCPRRKPALREESRLFRSNRRADGGGWPQRRCDTIC